MLAHRYFCFFNDFFYTEQIRERLIRASFIPTWCVGVCGSVRVIPDEAIQQRLMPSAGTMQSVSFTVGERR